MDILPIAAIIYQVMKFQRSSIHPEFHTTAKRIAYVAKDVSYDSCIPPFLFFVHYLTNLLYKIVLDPHMYHLFAQVCGYRLGACVDTALYGVRGGLSFIVGIFLETSHVLKYLVRYMTHIVWRHPQVSGTSFFGG